MNLRDYVLAASLNLPVTHTMRRECYKCGGHDSLAITMFDECVKWICYRASCDFQGISTKVPGRGGRNYAAPKKKEYKDYAGSLTHVTSDQYKVTFEKYLGMNRYDMLNWNGIKYSSQVGRFYIPHLDWYGNKIGYELRSWTAIPKTRSHKLTDTIPMHHAPIQNQIAKNTEAVILVEDFMSAMVVSLTGYRAISLCGSSMSHDMAHYLRDLSASNSTLLAERYLLMLDGDASTKSAEIISKYTGFLDIQARLLPKPLDPKDLSMLALKKLIENK